MSWAAALLELLGAAVSAIAAAVRPKPPEPVAPPPVEPGFAEADRRVDAAVHARESAPAVVVPPRGPTSSAVDRAEDVGAMGTSPDSAEVPTVRQR